MKKLTNSPIGFKIHQMEDNEVGLRNFDNKFKSSEFVAPISGRFTKDVVASAQSDLETDTKKDYEIYRENKQISNEELLRTHGTLYPEFKGVEQYFEDEKEKQEAIKETPIIFENKPVNEVEETPIIFENNTNQPGSNQSTTFQNVSFNAPKEDYSSKETTLPPFFFSSKPAEPVAQEEKVIETPQREHTPQPVVQNTISTYVTTPQSVERKVELHQKNKKPYVYPPYSLFDIPQKEEECSPDFIFENQEIINNTLEQFNINGRVENYTYGPTVTRYEIKLAPGVNVKKVPSVSDNIKMNLSAKTIRIEAPIPGKPHVGIEVPNRKARMVHYYDIINTKEFRESKKKLLIALGKDIDGKAVYNNIEDMPHGLIAGSTASGKSVCINTLLISLLVKNSPDDLRLILIDPKMVELTSYNNLPHLVTPVITNAELAVPALKWTVDEMERRYKLLTNNAVRNIEEYNELIETNPEIEKLPFILVVIDEFADLSSTCSQADLDDPIKRIAQKARAAGIHLIVATQRPSVDVIRGSIKNNIPGRIAFRVTASVDSQTILDSVGAEALLGKGDMLIRTVDGLTRVQGAYISNNEIKRITNYIKENNDCDFLFNHDELQKTEQQSVSSSSANNEDLELFYEAASFFIKAGSCSTNSLIIEFNIGYNRATKVVNELRRMGVVAQKTGTVSSEVLVTQEQLDEMFNKKG